MTACRKTPKATRLTHGGIRQRRVGVAVVPHIAMTSLLLACEPLRAVNRFFQSPVYELVFVAASLAPVRGEGGTVVKPAATFDDAETDLDLIVVAAMPERGGRSDDPVLQWARRHALRGAHLCGLDGGVAYLAQAGLLDGYRAALRVSQRALVADRYKRVRFTDALYAADRDRLTCGGGMAANDLFLTVVERDHGTEMARFVEADIISSPARRPETHRKPATRPALVNGRDHMRLAVELMEANVRDPLSIPEIADQLGVSVRQLQLLSRKHYNDTLSNQYLDIRLKAAQRMLMYSDKSIVEIAAETGFSSTSTFGRAFKRRFQTNAGGFRTSFGRAGSQPMMELRV